MILDNRLVILAKVHTKKGEFIMKKVFVLFLLVFMVGVSFAELRNNIKTEQTITVNAGAKFAVPDNGYLEVFSHGKVYVSLTGITPNASNRYISAGGNIDTQSYFYTSDFIGLLADSGVTTVNFTVYRAE